MNQMPINFQFWKEGNRDLAFTLTDEQLLNHWQQWRKVVPKVWYNSHSDEECLREFIMSEDGLQSTSEPSQFNVMFRIIKQSNQF